MSAFRFVLTGFAVALAIIPARAQDTKDVREEVLVKPTDDRRDLTLLKRLSDTQFLHEAARITYAIPKGWTEIRPHRLARKVDPRIMTVLGIERADRDLVASIYFLPMTPDRKLSDWVRDSAVHGEFGEEYETLKTVYGKDKVTTPVKARVGDFDMFKIGVSGGPERGEKYEGMLYVFDVTAGETTWLVRARISYPRIEKGTNEKFADEVIKGFAKAPEAPPAK